MEPEGDLRNELLGDLRRANESAERDRPQQLEAFGIYVDTLFDYLRARWHSAADVNASRTDDLFAVKHAFQRKIYGPDEEKGWEGWNRYFLDRIMTAAAANPGKRIVVIVGCEHGYWLRKHLRDAASLKLLDTESLLRVGTGR
jgi:hypothetical protein